ncbi:hypothetical protein [Mycoplasma hafezii]|uniref:hypothetical protein n=1 Tax=Mycoplasma hafezii TaxID=525886 RepID=UPI003CEA14D7
MSKVLDFINALSLTANSVLPNNQHMVVTQTVDLKTYEVRVQQDKITRISQKFMQAQLSEKEIEKYKNLETDDLVDKYLDDVQLSEVKNDLNSDYRIKNKTNGYYDRLTTNQDLNERNLGFEWDKVEHEIDKQEGNGTTKNIKEKFDNFNKNRSETNFSSSYGSVRWIDNSHIFDDYHVEETPSGKHITGKSELNYQPLLSREIEQDIRSKVENELKNSNNYFDNFKNSLFNTVEQKELLLKKSRDINIATSFFVALNWAIILGLLFAVFFGAAWAIKEFTTLTVANTISTAFLVQSWNEYYALEEDYKTLKETLELTKNNRLDYNHQLRATELIEQISEVAKENKISIKTLVDGYSKIGDFKFIIKRDGEFFTLGLNDLIYEKIAEYTDNFWNVALKPLIAKSNPGIITKLNNFNSWRYKIGDKLHLTKEITKPKLTKICSPTDVMENVRTWISNIKNMKLKNLCDLFRGFWKNPDAVFNVAKIIIDAAETTTMFALKKDFEELQVTVENAVVALAEKIILC